MAFQKLNSLRSIAQSLELRACNHRRRDDSFILELVLGTVGRSTGPPHLLPHAQVNTTSDKSDKNIEDRDKGVEKWFEHPPPDAKS
jgi:hypothetical protein